jgi:alkyl hydroperoxide reductase subunit AhpC
MTSDKTGGCCSRGVQIGKKAPEFTMEGYFKGEMKKFSLADYRG